MNPTLSAGQRVFPLVNLLSVAACCGLLRPVLWCYIPVGDAPQKPFSSATITHRFELAATSGTAVLVSQLPVSTSRDRHVPSDATLIKSVRAGEKDKYQQLYQRHHAAAKALAQRLARNDIEADDLVAEAFTNILDAILNGKGPREAFRPYLLTTVRNNAYGKTRTDKRIQLTDDIHTTGNAATTTPFRDTAVENLEHSLAARAYYQLPERWQTVLWHTVVKQQTPAEVAPILGLTPNAVAVLANRAREGLKQQYLQAHLSNVSETRCREVAGKLGAWTRHALSRRDASKVEVHLDKCDECRALAEELRDVNSSLRSILPFLLLGGAAAGYLSASAAAAPAAAAVEGGTSSTASIGRRSKSSTQGLVGAGVAAAAVVTAVAVALTSGGAAPSSVNASPPDGTSPYSADGEGTFSASVPSRPASDSDPSEPLSEIEGNQGVPSGVDNPAAAGGRAPTSAPTSAMKPSPDEKASTRPVITVSTPEQDVTMHAGEGPVTVDVVARNTGSVGAADAVLTLSLPPGVEVVSGGGASGGGASPTSVVHCPAGRGTVICRSAGWAPGGELVFRVRLVASLDAQRGSIAGTLDVAGADSVRFTVPVVVDVPRDVARLSLSREGVRLVRVVLRNDGSVSRPGSVTIEGPAYTSRVWAQLSCHRFVSLTRCETRRELAPGEQVRLWFVVNPGWRITEDGEGSVRVTGTVGEDSTEARLSLRRLF